MPANPLTDPNWATETTDKLVSLIDNVRAQTTQKVVYAARGAVFGVIAIMLGTLIAIVALVGLLRGVTALLELAVGWERAVYLSYLIVGAVFSLVGLVLFRQAQQRCCQLTFDQLRRRPSPHSIHEELPCQTFATSSSSGPARRVSPLRSTPPGPTSPRC